MNKTQEAYNSYAGKYESKFAGYDIYKKHIAYFAGLLKKGSPILDIGCGPGINAALMTEKGHKVTGIDFSSAMIELAQKNCPDGTFSVKKVEEFESSEQFNALCLSFIIVHLKDEETESLISKLPGLVSPDGLVYISFMTGKPPGYETTSFSEKEIFFNYYDPHEIIKKFERAGFSLIDRKSEPYTEPDGNITEDIFLILKKGTLNGIK